MLFLLHLLAAILWIGGMAFAYAILRPVAANLLEPPSRLNLWKAVFEKFFPWVWVFVVILPVTGYGMVFSLFQGFANVGMAIHMMHLLGWFMIAVFLYVYFSPYKALARQVSLQDYPAAGSSLNRIRQMIGLNLILGLFIVLVMGLSRF